MTRPAIQLYSVRDLDEPLPEVIRRVADAGFEGVEFATRLADADLDAVAAALDETGLEAVAAHVDLATLEANTESVLERCTAVDCRRIVVPHLPGRQFRTRQRTKTLAERLERVGRTLAERDFELLYHNLEDDLEPVLSDRGLGRVVDALPLPGAAEDRLIDTMAQGPRKARSLGQTGFDGLASQADPDLVGFEIDVGEVAAAEWDPATVLNYYRGRAPLVHVRDVARVGAEYHSADPGTGVVDFADAVEAAERNGAEWVVYEHDDPSDPEETIRQGAAALLGAMGRDVPQPEQVAEVHGDGGTLTESGGGGQFTTRPSETPAVTFRHERIDDDAPARRMSFCLTTDLTGNGREDVVVGALGDDWTVTIPGLGKRVNLLGLPVVSDLVDRLEPNLFWYENPGWERHEVGYAHDLSVGGALGDLTGNGRVDLVTGQNLGTELYWFEQPSDPTAQWTRRLVTDDFRKYHDVAIADVDNDGEDEVVVLSQKSATVFYYDVPEDPAQEPWPTDHRHVIADDLDVEGVSVVDIDGDGDNELLAGPNVFRKDETTGGWVHESIAEGWEWTRLAVADLDDDGDLEVVITEGDLPYQGDRMGRLGIFDPPNWEETVLRDDLSNPHTLQVADFDGDGRPDIYVAEMGLELKDNPGFDPEQILFRNLGDGEFESTTIDRGVPTHEAKAVDIDNDGDVDIVGKSYDPTRHVDVWYNESN
jgi:sugar phosphate isomerase/epimerase